MVIGVDCTNEHRRVDLQAVDMVKCYKSVYVTITLQLPQGGAIDGSYI